MVMEAILLHKFYEVYQVLQWLHIVPPGMLK
jgi:hypothetical protein